MGSVEGVGGPGLGGARGALLHRFKRQRTPDECGRQAVSTLRWRRPWIGREHVGHERGTVGAGRHRAGRELACGRGDALGLEGGPLDTFYSGPRTQDGSRSIRDSRALKRGDEAVGTDRGVFGCGVGTLGAHGKVGGNQGGFARRHPRAFNGGLDSAFELFGLESGAIAEDGRLWIMGASSPRGEVDAATGLEGGFGRGLGVRRQFRGARTVLGP